MNNQGFQGTETYLIECSRENSLINKIDDENTNGTWTTSTNFNIKAGDKINIEMVCANIAGSGASSPTIELTGSNLKINNEEKNYCDTKCLIEVFFYLNNNNTYTVGLPLLHPYGGINGSGDAGGAPGTVFNNIQMPVTFPTEYGPNAISGTPGGRTNQPCNYREPNMGDGYIYQLIDPMNSAASVAISANNNHYHVYQYQTEPIGGGIAVWLPAGVGVLGVAPPAAIRIRAIRIAQVAPPIGGGVLFTNFTQGYIGGFQQNSVDLKTKQCSWEVGQKVIINMDGDDLFCCGTITEINGSSDGGGGGNYLELVLDESTTVVNGASTIDAAIPTGRTANAYSETNPYIGDLDLDVVIGWDMPIFNLKSFSSGIGLINYDNLNNKGLGTEADLLTYHRGHNNALFNYADYVGKILARAPILPTQIPAPSKNRQFPHNRFDPNVYSDVTPRNTSIAGNYGSFLMPGAAEPNRPHSGYRNSNVREECNNNPYIMMRQDCMGQGRRNPDGSSTPRAKPMSAFIYIDIKDLLQNIDSLADYINDRLHETIEGMGNSSEDLDVLLNNNLQNPNSKKPSSNITPTYNRYGFYDWGAARNVLVPAPPATGGDVFVALPKNYKYQKIFTDVIPMKYGGCAKVIPANFSAGDDYLNTAFGRSWMSDPNVSSNISNQETIDEIVESTYLRRVRNQFTAVAADSAKANSGNMGGFANPIYGNFASADMYKFCLGDAWNRLPIWDCVGQLAYNKLSGVSQFYSYRVGKPIIMNNYLVYTPLEFDTPDGLIYPWSIDPYPTPLPAPATSSQVTNIAPNTLYEGQLIYTNIEFPIEDTENNDWAELAEAIKNSELYYNISSTAPSNIVQQNKDNKNWILDLDVGITDDKLMGQTNQDWGQPAVNPPPAGMIDAENVIVGATYTTYQQNNTPLVPDWVCTPPLSARSDPLAEPFQKIYGTAVGYSIGTGGALPAQHNEKREMFCPTRTFDAFAQATGTGTFDNNYFTQLRKALGHIKIKSRWDDEYIENSKNYKGFFAYNSSSLPPEPLDEGFREAHTYQENVFINGKSWDPKPMIQYMKSLNLGFIPYIHYPLLAESGTPGVYAYDLTKGRVLCAVRVGADYTPKANSLSSINFGQMCWGNTIGVSPSFNDTHGIVPMNNDELKQTDILEVITDNAGATAARPSNRLDRYNMVNNIMTGADNPTFRYNSENGKCEFINLQQDNILNELATPYKKSTVDAPTITTQIGSKCGIINSASGDACFGRLENDGGTLLLTTQPNKGIRAEISGVGILNIWLCPESYNPPQDINLGAYWDNGQGKDGPNFNNSNRLKGTEEKRQEIIKGCTKASSDDWEGTLFSRLGFKNIYELLPLYGKQDNRFNPNTYNSQIPSQIGRGTKPLILCNETDNTINPAIHTFYTSSVSSTGPPAITQPTSGEPLFSLGCINNEQSVFGTTSQALTASRAPIFTTSPFLLIESDICQTNYRSGKTQQDGLFYLMKNYSSNGYIYGYGSSYAHTSNQDRLLSTITTQFRNPTTGKLQKCSANSTIIYKITRNIFVAPPSNDVFGLIKPQAPQMSTTDKLLSEILQAENFNSAGLSNITGSKSKVRGKSGVPSTRVNRGHPRQVRNADIQDNSIAGSVASSESSHYQGHDQYGNSIHGSVASQSEQSQTSTRASSGVSFVYDEEADADFMEEFGIDRYGNTPSVGQMEEGRRRLPPIYERGARETKTTQEKIEDSMYAGMGESAVNQTLSQILGGLGLLIMQENPTSFFETTTDEEGGTSGYRLIPGINIGDVASRLILSSIYEDNDTREAFLTYMDAINRQIQSGNLNQGQIAQSLSNLWDIINTTTENEDNDDGNVTQDPFTPLLVYDPAAENGPEGQQDPILLTQNLGEQIYNSYIEYQENDPQSIAELGEVTNNIQAILDESLMGNVILMEVPTAPTGQFNEWFVPVRSSIVTAYTLQPDQDGINIPEPLGTGELVPSLHPSGTLNFELSGGYQNISYLADNDRGFDMDAYEETESALVGLGVVQPRPTHGMGMIQLAAGPDVVTTDRLPPTTNQGITERTGTTKEATPGQERGRGTPSVAKSTNTQSTVPFDASSSAESKVESEKSTKK